MFTRSGKRIRENYLEDNDIPKTTRKTSRKRQKENAESENATNSNTDRPSVSIFPKNNAENCDKMCDQPKRTLRSKSINVLNADPISKIPKISNTKKNKRKNVDEIDCGNESEKRSTRSNKKAKMCIAPSDTNTDGMQNGDNVYLDIVVKVDHKINDLEKEIDLKKDSIGSVDTLASAAGDTCILLDENATKTSAGDGVSDNVIDSQSDSSFKSNITCNVSVGENFTFDKNSVNRTYDKLQSVEAQTKGPGSPNTLASAAGDTCILHDENATKTSAGDGVSDNVIDSQSDSSFKSNITCNVSVGENFTFDKNSVNRTYDKLQSVEAQTKGPGSPNTLASAAGDTCILHDENATKTSAGDGVSDNVIDSRSDSSFKSNITLNVSVDENFSFDKNSVNRTYDKLQSVEAQTKGPGSPNRTFDKTDIESLDGESSSSRLNTENNVSTLSNDNSLEKKEKCEVTHSSALHSITDNSADSSQIKIDPDSTDQPDSKYDQPDSKSDAEKSLIRQNTFTKEDEICSQQTVTPSNIRASNMCLESVANRTRSVERPAAISSVVTPSMTSINILISKAGAGRKRSRTEGAAPLTPRTPAAGGRGSGGGSGSNVRPARTKLPDFAELHRRRFAKMESLDEHQQRRADRARRLLQQRPARTPGDPPRKKEVVTRNAVYNRFGFKVKSEAVEPAAVVPAAVAPLAVVPAPVVPAAVEAAPVAWSAGMRKAVAPAPVAPGVASAGVRGRVGVVREARAHCRSLLRGVRTNRRFELLMQARRAAL